ncbi:MAG: thiamine pyrophosphate-binding protein [Clostridiales bacterium]|nr:thiamine pyrophosphate-binding protein [Clostridiales bacterium]
MKLTGGEIVVKYLVKEGVPYILGIPGHGVMGLFDAIRREEAAGKIKYIQVKHEQAATAMADGYYRMTGKPLASFASIGPGTLNACIGLGTAYVDSTAFIQFCGDTHVHMKGVGVLQEIEKYADSNIVRALEPLSKRSWRAESASQLPKIMKRAFYGMESGRIGPYSVSLPMDVQCDFARVAPQYFEDRPKQTIACADGEDIKKALDMLKAAKRPVILAGGGALRARAGELIEKLAELSAAAVITTMAGKGVVAEDHPNYGFHTGSKGTPVGVELCRKADLVLALGTRFADETTCSYRKGISFNFPDTKLIHVDSDSGEIGKNYTADLGINADLSKTLQALIENFGPAVSSKDAYLDEIKELKAKWAEKLAKIRSAKTENITISQLIGELNRHLPEDTVIATSSGNTQAQFFQEYIYKKPYCNLTTGGFSTMGWSFPAAMGAKLACPESPVVCLVGDGDFMMVMQEMATMVQYDIPVVIVLANNSGWLAIKDLQEDVYGSAAAFGNDWEKDGQIYSPDFVKIAQAFGLHTQDISRPEEVEAALKNAFDSGKPALIHVEVCREYPYSGGQAFGWWDVPVPEYDQTRRKLYEDALKEETL